MGEKSRFMIIGAVMGSLTALGEFIKIPIAPYPVPMTLQTGFVFLAGMLLPKREAFLSQAAYILLGLIGIPVFAHGGGLGYILDPTFGYLLAFLFCAPLMSILYNKTLLRRKYILFALFSVLLILILQLCGVIYMAVISSLHLHTKLPFSKAAYLTLLFLPLDIVKLLLAALFSIQIRKRLPFLSLEHNHAKQLSRIP